jgi:MFS family permease
MESVSGMRRKEWLALLLSNILVSIGIGMITPIYLIYISQKFGDVSLFFNSYGIFAISLAVFEFVAGYLADIHGPKKILLSGILMSSLTSLGYMLVSSALQVYVLEISSALSTSLQTPALNTLISSFSSERKRGRSFGLFNSFSNFFYGTASVISGILIGYFGMNAIFLVSFYLQAFSALIIFHSKFKL